MNAIKEILRNKEVKKASKKMSKELVKFLMKSDVTISKRKDNTFFIKIKRE